MNLYAILASALIWLGTCVGAFFYGTEVGDDHAAAAVAREERIGRSAAAAAASAAASAIASIEVKNVTIQQKLQREVLTREVFRDCRSGDDAVRLLNSTSGISPTAPDPAASGVVPAASAPR